MASLGRRLLLAPHPTIPAAYRFGEGVAGQALSCDPNAQEGASWSYGNTSVNVLDYGAIGALVNGQKVNDTHAFELAIAALPDTGGTVIVPGGYSFAINLTIDRPKIRLLGQAMGRVGSAVYPAGLIPFDNTQFVVTVSSDSHLNEGVVLDTLEFNGEGVGYYGLRLLGGCYQQTYNNITIANFTKKLLWVKSGAAFPCVFVYFTNLGLQPANTAAWEHNILVEHGNTLQYCEAIFFCNVRNSGLAGTTPGVGWGCEIAGSGGTVFTNAYFQINTAHGVRLTKPFQYSPRLNGNALFLDSDSSADTLVTIVPTTASNLINEWVFGYVGIDGKVDCGGTLRTNTSPIHIPDLTELIEPVMVASAFLADATDPSARTMSISGDTASGTVRLLSAANVELLAGALNHIYGIIGGVKVTNTEAAAFLPFNDNVQNLGRASARWAHMFAVAANVSGLSTHADNAAALAAGLVAGDFYRTAAGVLMVVF